MASTNTHFSEVNWNGCSPTIWIFPVETAKAFGLKSSSRWKLATNSAQWVEWNRRKKYWAICSLIHLHDLFASSAMFSLLARSAALMCSRAPLRLCARAPLHLCARTLRCAHVLGHSAALICSLARSLLDSWDRRFLSLKWLEHAIS